MIYFDAKNKSYKLLIIKFFLFQEVQTHLEFIQFLQIIHHLVAKHNLPLVLLNVMVKVV